MNHANITQVTFKNTLSFYWEFFCCRVDRTLQVHFYLNSIHSRFFTFQIDGIFYTVENAQPLNAMFAWFYFSWIGAIASLMSRRTPMKGTHEKDSPISSVSGLWVWWTQKQSILCTL